MVKLEIFEYNDVEIRTQVDANGNPWFCAKDVCTILELKDVSKACKSLDEEDKGTLRSRTLGGEQELLFVSESGLYELMTKSKKAPAKEFKKWVFSVVLPTLRRTGTYSIKPVEPMSQVEILHQSTVILLEQEKQLKLVANQVELHETKLEIIESRLNLVEEIKPNLKVPVGWTSLSDIVDFESFNCGVYGVYIKEVLLKLVEHQRIALSYRDKFTGEVRTNPEAYIFKTDQVTKAMQQFLNSLINDTSCNYYSKLLNKRVRKNSIKNKNIINKLK